MVEPEVLKEVFNSWSFTNDVLSLFNLDCSDYDFQSTFRLKACGPLILLAECVLFAGVWHIYKEYVNRSAVAVDINRLTNVYPYTPQMRIRVRGVQKHPILEHIRLCGYRDYSSYVIPHRTD